MEVALQPGDLVEAAFDVVGLGLDLLHAHTIGAHAFGPRLEALGRCRADAVQVQRDEAEHDECPHGRQAPESDASWRSEFVQFAVEAGVLRFGEFKTKAGRLSPYFFNSGLFDDGAKLLRLGEFYARRLLASGLAFDMLFGPAYKGITLAAAIAIELARLRPQRAVRLQPQGSKGSRRGRTLSSARRCGAARSSSMT